MPNECVIPPELFDPLNAPLLTGILRGVEREALRVDPQGKLALTPHPEALGSALMHPRITTDFSESLLEFITPPSHRIEELFEQLSELHQFTGKHLNDEILWSSSMPCELATDENIPVARYGTSNNGLMKSVYRIGLGHRYGRTMQTVSGLHYNFSLPNAFWAFLSRHENSSLSLQDFKNQKYFSLIRNFRRYYWLLIYLFGASPAICRSFARGKPHNLSPLANDDHTLHLPYATSLRMGDLGYQSNAQESLYVCYNDQNSYINTLCNAITSNHPAYSEIGLVDPSSGKHKQLNTSLLQIENEFYSAIRPKRTAKPGETALAALKNRGVEYIEVRCLDINPFAPLGVTPQQIYFLDTFLLFCALQDSPDCDRAGSDVILTNQKTVVSQGRDKNAMLKQANGNMISLQKWALKLTQDMKGVAELLDKANSGINHQNSLEAQLAKVHQPELTPSAQVLRELIDNKQTFPKYTLQQSQEHHNTLTASTLSKNSQARLASMTKQSTLDQKHLENESSENFDTFLKKYYAQYKHCEESQEA